jgi:GT2 family glycosyltransferase/glycosyltransferase involved in cell wall biosynthesis
MAYEVIVVDDDGAAATKSLLNTVTGAKILVNEKNLGYLRSANRGAAVARGRYIALLNDDCEPQPRWLSAMVARAESAPDIGVVVAKLLYPTGVLQEAGSIIWSDGAAENFGKGQDHRAPEFNYAREVDYGSAAAALVRSDVWALAGGFDERYAPGYWEDVDLCFTARKHGWRVMYEPEAEVVHLEGAVHGTSDTQDGKRHQRLNASRFSAKWTREIADQPRRATASTPYLASDHRGGPIVLVADDKVPTPDRDAGSARMMALVEALVQLDCRVVFLPDSAAPTQPYTRQLQALGVEVLVGPVDLRARLEQIGPNLRLAILSRPYVAPRYLHLVRRFSPEARIVYDTVDLHFAREERRQRQTGSSDMGVPQAFKELELADARAADVTFVVTDAERDRLLSECPDLDVEVVPMAHDVWDEVPGPGARAGLLFVGGYGHHPNVDAALHLCQEIMPLVHRDLNGVKLSLVGPDPPAEIRALASERVEVTGWVEDLRPLLETVAVSVAPLRYGGGMNGKITQSLAAGLPVVTTSVGCEGLGAEDGKHLFVADEPALFAERIVALHRDNDLWRSLSDGGRHIARTVTSRERQVEVLRRMLTRD